MEVKIQRKVWLTPRDCHLLEELYQNVVLSFPQVAAKIFPGCAKSTILNRLARLEAFGVLIRWKLPRLNAGINGSEILVVFQLTRQGIRELKKRGWKGGERDIPVRLHGHSIFHDVLLVDVMDALKARFPGSTITHGKLEEREGSEKVIHPDAILEFPGSSEKWAVELELTVKSEKRYREIVLRYRLDRNFARVLYVIPTDRVMHKLAKVLDQKPEVLSEKPPSSKFLCISLDALCQINGSKNQITKIERHL